MKHYCVQCGRELDKPYKHSLCGKHWSQFHQYGFCLEDSQMTENDPNEIIIEGDIAKIVLYDFLFNELDEYVIIDVEDIEKVNKYHWKKQQNCIVAMEYGSPILLANIIL